MWKYRLGFQKNLKHKTNVKCKTKKNVMRKLIINIYYFYHIDWLIFFIYMFFLINIVILVDFSTVMFWS